MAARSPHIAMDTEQRSADAAPARPARNVAAVRQGDRTILLDVTRGRFYGLDGVAGRFWKMFTDGAELAEIEVQIEREYDVPRERIGRDLRALIEQLRVRGLVS
jgi:hypothetical protein